MRGRRREPSLWMSTLLALVFVVALPVDARGECDPAGVCVEGAAWSPDSMLDDKARAKELKKNRKKADVLLHVVVEGGRGSVFVDGIWVAEAPIEGIPIKPGRHDLQIRDGLEVLARGILKIPAKGGPVRVRAPHG